MEDQTHPILSVRNLTTTIHSKRGDFAAVDNISFDVEAGETLGVVGESGSGKSLTGLSLLRLLPDQVASLSGGTICLDGVDLQQLSEKEMRSIRGKDIAMILQDPQTSLNPAFTVGNQIVEALKLHREKPAGGWREMAVEALRKVRVAAPETRVDAFPHEMSGGMRQRVVGAIAISCMPKVIIADEPTTSLDVTVQAQYLKLLAELQRETGMAVVFITHDFGIVAKVCHRLAVMYAGQIVETGSVRDIFNNPSHPYTEALLNSVPKLSGDKGRLPSIEGQPPALWNQPTGCRFAPRCRYAEAKCFESEPPTFDIEEPSGKEHSAKCWRLAS
jgi:oligopeptide/dipeptide ABC transporter ATP-binding protein